MDLPPRGGGKRVNVGMGCRRRHRAGAGNEAINEAIKILPGGESLMRAINEAIMRASPEYAS